MWRKPTNAKPSSPAPEEATTSPEVPVVSQQVKVQPMPEPPAASQTAAPAPAIPVAPPAPAYQGPASRMVVAHDTPATSSIGTGLKIRGELSGSSDLYIDGEAQGKITLLDSRVTVGPNGRVQADIEAREIVIEGSVQGNLKAREHVRLASSSAVQGSIVTPRIGVDDGAKLRGKVEMTRSGEAKGSQGFAASDKPASSPVLKAVATSVKGE